MNTLAGVCVSAGRMMKAVKVRTTHQKYNSFVRKHFRTYKHHLVSDPSSSVRTGDVVRISATPQRLSRHIQHIVTEIIAPYGMPLEERPPLLGYAEMEAQRRKKRDAKLERRKERRRRGALTKEDREDIGEDVENRGVPEAGKLRVGKSMAEKTARMVEKTRGLEGRALGSGRDAEAVQERLDGQGLGSTDVAKRLEGMRL